MRSDSKLNQLLEQRRSPPGCDHLTQRIINVVAKIPQQHHLGLLSWIKQIFADYAVLRPAYLLASILLIGFFTGFWLPSTESSKPGIYSSELEEFLYEDEVII